MRALQEALQLTEAVAGAAVTPDLVRDMLLRRAPLLERATEAREQGVPWGLEEARIAQRIADLDRGLVEALWRPRRDAFAWLSERDETVLAAMPHVAALDRAD